MPAKADKSGAPKKPLSAFFWFCSEERPKVKAANPDIAFGDVAKELGKQWAVVDEATKAKYQAKADEDKIRYQKELDAQQG